MIIIADTTPLSELAKKGTYISSSFYQQILAIAQEL
jgi:predicted nucleic acid-binding protein